MTIRMFIELAMLAACLGFGAYAIGAWRRAGVPLLDGFGLRWRGSSAPDLVAGLVIAGGAMGGIFLAERGLGAITASVAAQPESLVAHALLMTAFTFKEEFLMRSLLLSGLLLALRGRAWLAIALSAVAFGCIHLSNPGSTPLSILGNSLGGVIYGMAFVLTRGLWMPLGLHFGWNFVQGPLLGLPVSGLASGGLLTVTGIGPAWLTGGSYGPEGGAIGIAFRFVIIALILLWARRRPQSLLQVRPA